MASVRLRPYPRLGVDWTTQQGLKKKTKTVKGPWVEVGCKDRGQAVLGAPPSWTEKMAWPDWGAWGCTPWRGWARVLGAPALQPSCFPAPGCAASSAAPTGP